MDTSTAITHFFRDTILPLGIVVGLPVSIVWIFFRYLINHTNQRADIIKLAIESNAQTDLSKLISGLDSKAPTKGLKYKLLTRLQLGAIFTGLGLAILTFALLIDYHGSAETNAIIYLSSFLLLFAGIAIIIVFCISTKMMKDELEAEKLAAKKENLADK